MLWTPQELRAALRRRKDLADLTLELSGLTSGMIPRFLRPDQIRKIRKAAGVMTEGETASELAWRRTLELTDHIARELAHIDRAIRRALDRAERRVQGAQKALEDIQSRATVEGKGRRVYRTADRRRGFTDDGDELTREEIDSIRWRPDAPSWEQRQAAGKRLADAIDERETILRYNDRADYYAQRMRSGDILTEDELESIRADLNAMPEAVRAEMEQGAPAAPRQTEAAPANSPSRRTSWRRSAERPPRTRARIFHPNSENPLWVKPAMPT